MIGAIIMMGAMMGPHTRCGVSMCSREMAVSDAIAGVTVGLTVIPQVPQSASK